MSAATTGNSAAPRTSAAPVAPTAPVAPVAPVAPSVASGAAAPAATTTTGAVPAAGGSAPTGFRSDALPDRVMRRLLGVRALTPGSSEGAHRAFRISVVFSGIRCLITYLLVPVLVPMASLAGWVAAPIGIALCVYAVVNGIVSLKRFWRSDHPQRWVYTIFMTIVFVILGLALGSDLSRLGAL